MTEDIFAKHEVMLESARNVHRCHDDLTDTERRFSDDAPLDDAIPKAEDSMKTFAPLDMLYNLIAAHARGPYAEVTSAMDDCLRQLADRMEQTSLDLKKSADEYLAREQDAIDGFTNIPDGN